MKNRNLIAIIFLLIILAFSAVFPYISSLLPKKAPEQGVKRVILISIDSCNPEYISPAYMPHLYARILQDGVKFKFATNIVPAETQCAHTTMLTGAFPSHTGIVGNGMYFPENWTDPVTHEVVYPKGTQIATFIDPRLRTAKTIFEQFQGNASIKTAFVSGKWRLIPLLSGGANQIFGNAKNGTIMIPPEYYMKVGSYFTYAEGDSVDIWIMNCLIELLKNEPDTNFIFVNLAFTDDVQHSGATFSEMVAEQLRELDNLFLRLFNELESLGIYDSTLFAITADHGADKTEYVLNLFDIFEQSASPHIEAHIFAEGQTAYIFLNNTAQLTDALNLLGAQPGIDLIVPRDNSSVVGYSNYSAYNLYPYQNRTGDIFITTFEGGATIITPMVPFMLFGIHGGPSTMDIPLSFICKNLNFKPEFRGVEIINQIPRTVDILPTIASIMNWSLNLMTLDGHPLDIIS